MPLKPGNSIGANIRELHQGPQYAATKAKHGAGTANKQAVAIAEKTAGNARPKKKRSKTDWKAAGLAGPAKPM